MKLIDVILLGNVIGREKGVMEMNEQELERTRRASLFFLFSQPLRTRMTRSVRFGFIVAVRL